MPSNCNHTLFMWTSVLPFQETEKLMVWYSLYLVSLGNTIVLVPALLIVCKFIFEISPNIS